ncbi:uncharacterized protein LOC101855958 [Aplysia californica]|uniref:Uncharacterized protein LOC101855958 n=1 Tax=Aplysia californica TaxID=6500 RepID=A0ABM0JUR2_APLCA|nr:uncharacterized protein LOC101855958 [Aplysia californica]
MALAVPLVLNFALFLIAVPLVTVDCGSEGSSDSDPQPCCFPKQFTTYNSDAEKRIWAKSSFDFVNQRKIVNVIDSDSNDFYYTDMKAGRTYEHLGGTCKYFTTPGITRVHITFPCIPDDSQLIDQGGSLRANTWEVNSNGMSGFISVSQDKCYPITASLTDTDSGFSLYVFLTSITEGIDESAFDVDLSDCTEV